MQISFDLNVPLLGRYLRVFVFCAFKYKPQYIYYHALYTYTHTHIHTKIYLYLCIHMCIYIYMNHIHMCVCVCIYIYIYMKQVFDEAIFAFIRYETWLYFLSYAFCIILFYFILLNKILVTIFILQLTGGFEKHYLKELPRIYIRCVQWCSL